MPKEFKELVFVFNDQVDGKWLTLANVDLPTLRGFLEEVETLIQGNERTTTLANSRIKLESGSIILKVSMDAVLAANLERDLDKLSRTGDLDLIQPLRAEIIERWQARTRHSPACVYSVGGIGAEGGPVFTVSDASQFAHRSENFWVATKRYLTGEIVDAGGKRDPNLHLVLPTGATERIFASQKQIHDKEENPLYRKITVYVQAEQHLSSKKLRNIKLIRFVQPPVGDTHATTLAELWQHAGRAWAEVPSATAWVERLRGN